MTTSSVNVPTLSQLFEWLNKHSDHCLSGPKDEQLEQDALITRYAAHCIESLSQATEILKEAGWVHTHGDVPSVLGSLLDVVQRLPVTADGIRVVPGMTLYTKHGDEIEMDWNNLDVEIVCLYGEKS